MIEVYSCCVGAVALLCKQHPLVAKRCYSFSYQIGPILAHMTQPEEEINSNLFKSSQVATHLSRDQSLPALQPTAIERKHVLGQLQ